jgi:hypothetical protein
MHFFESNTINGFINFSIGIGVGIGIGIGFLQPLFRSRLPHRWRLTLSRLPSQIFINLHPKPLYWAPTLSQADGIIVLIGCPAFS